MLLCACTVDCTIKQRKAVVCIRHMKCFDDIQLFICAFETTKNAFFLRVFDLAFSDLPKFGIGNDLVMNSLRQNIRLVLY